MSNGDRAAAAVSIDAVWTRLGGGPLRKGRGKAFWRAGGDFNVSVNQAKGLWYDFRDQSGGGVLQLIEVVLGCDRRGAIRWLVESFSLPIELDRPLTAIERQQYQNAIKEAERFLKWRRDRLLELRGRRNYWLNLYHCALRKIITYGLDHPLGEFWSDGCVAFEQRYLELEKEIDRFEQAGFTELIPQFRTESRKLR
jgi:hypothetical protein